MGARERIEARERARVKAQHGIKQDLEIMEIGITSAEEMKLPTVFFMKAVLRILKVILERGNMI